MDIIKFRVYEMNPSHVKVMVFNGKEGFTLHNIGQLCFDHKGFEVFRLGITASSFSDLCIVIEDEMFVDYERFEKERKDDIVLDSMRSKE